MNLKLLNLQECESKPTINSQGFKIFETIKRYLAIDSIRGQNVESASAFWDYNISFRHWNPHSKTQIKQLCWDIQYGFKKSACRTWYFLQRLQIRQLIEKILDESVFWLETSIATRKNHTTSIANIERIRFHQKMAGRI